MSITVIISAQISNFYIWKFKFDNLEEQRLAAGISASLDERGNIAIDF